MGLLNTRSDENTNMIREVNQKFTNNFLHLKPMDSQIGEVGGVFNEEHYDIDCSFPRVETQAYPDRERMF